MSTLAFIQNIGPLQLVIILIIALLLFGRRLPEVGRSLGRGIVEFRKGLHGIEKEIDEASRAEELPEGGRSHKDSQPADRAATPSAPPPAGDRVSHSQPHPGTQP